MDVMEELPGLERRSEGMTLQEGRMEIMDMGDVAVRPLTRGQALQS